VNPLPNALEYEYHVQINTHSSGWQTRGPAFKLVSDAEYYMIGRASTLAPSYGWRVLKVPLRLPEPEVVLSYQRS
jgi:hypothetical protein